MLSEISTVINTAINLAGLWYDNMLHTIDIFPNDENLQVAN